MLGTAPDNQASEGVPMWIIAAGLAAVAYYVMTQSRKKTVDQDADDARSRNPRFRRFNRRWMR
jgi:hypothetical protein